MRKSTTLDWIEQAEATRVLTDAAFEEASPPAWRDTAAAALATIGAHLRGWLSPLPSPGVPAAQPARVRAARRACDDHDYGRSW